jgi:hypothetical protein
MYLPYILVQLYILGLCAGPPTSSGRPFFCGMFYLSLNRDTKLFTEIQNCG